VSNRLSITAKREEGVWNFTNSVGGVATGLTSYLETLRRDGGGPAEYVWVGWPGVNVEEEYKEEVRDRLLGQFQSLPVFLTEAEVENFYQGFCNKTIWPLYHYFPEFTNYKQEYWLNYRKVNEAFCDTLAGIVKKGDVVWIHDYHLMLLPKLLREKIPDATIGFFLHIPFPTYELFRLMPALWRNDILEGLLGADLIGFHTYDYLHYFLRCVLRILGIEHNVGQIMINDRVVSAGVYPMGIDFNKFSTTASSPHISDEQAVVKQSVGEAKIVLSIDRLDYTKGINNRLDAFELLLERSPEWRERLVLILIVVPSRIGVDQYEMRKRQIEEQVGKINGRFGTLGWTPIRYQYRALDFGPMVALYSMSDVALITPLRDGMNLIAKEYIACRTNQTGVLILSEMAGAAQELGEAIIINPNNREEIATAIEDALAMPKEEQISRNRIMQNRLKRYNIFKWANEFIGKLSTQLESPPVLATNFLTKVAQEQLFKEYQQSAPRLLALDYDGTLVKFGRNPDDVKPPKELMQLLVSLSQDPANDLVIISGRNRTYLDRWFASMEIDIVAEHGAWVKERGGEWKLLKPVTSEWKENILPILERHADRLPGSFVETKEYSLAWHYRKANPEQGGHMAHELMDDLVAFTANIDLQVLQGNKVIEVRNAGVNKGAAFSHLLSRKKYLFLLGAGDDWTDEDLFSAMPKDAYSIRVGYGRTAARFHVRSHLDVLNLLHELSKLAGIKVEAD
jgi:trehalose 6-phosphate synthase/phosphatase